MKPYLILFTLFLAFAGVSEAQSRRVAPTPTPEKDDDPVRVVTEEVKVNVLAFDDDGKFAGNVTEKDLVISENNILHQATSVRRLPANVLIVMDTGGELRQVKSLDQTRNVAKAVVAGLHPEDLIAVVQYADSAEVAAEWTSDRSQIMNAIGRTKFGRKSAFVDALKLSTDLLVKNPADNRHLVLITDGTDSSANPSAKNAAMRNLLATDINVHVISYTRMEAEDIAPRTKMLSKTPPPKAMPDEVAAQLPNGVRDAARAPKIGPTINLDRTLLRRLRARKDDLEASEIALANLAENTNGEILIPESKDEMIEKSALIAKYIDSSYVLTYTPKIPLTENSADRNIIVTSKRPGLQVQARRKLIVNPAN